MRLYKTANPPRIAKIYHLKSAINNMPQLHYLDVYIVNDNNEILTSTKALVDTGCAKTALSSKFFKTISIKTPITKTPLINVQTCDGTHHSVEGTVDLSVIIGQSKQIRTTINVLIIENLADDLLLGLDFLASKIIHKITPNAIYMKQDSSIIIEEFCKVDFLINTIKPAGRYVEPNQIATMMWKMPENNEQTIKCMKIKPGLMLIEQPTLKNNIFMAKLFNTSNNCISLNCNDNILKIRKMQFPLSIPHDEYMTLDEYDHTVKKFKDNGFHQPSITSYIENKNTITELDEFEEPSFVTDEELINQFEIDHLPFKIREQFSDIVLENRDAFSTHKWDIGVTNMIEMDINVKTPELRIQKYIPIPLHTRDKVKDILDQFLRVGIIRHCTEPSKYCSNILVVPKKDKDSIRLLFDGRLLNYDTERLPMASISKSEILSQLAGKDHLSSLDFADAFYHIPLSKEAQPLTAFYAHTHALRMCFTRAPQGLKNSPLYLKILLDKIFCDMTSDVLFYADDLLIATKGSLEDHLKIVHKVIVKIREAGLKVRPAKVLLARKSLEFLGMVFEKNTLNIPKMRLEAFRNLPSPNTPKKLKSVICALAYYRHFVPKFSDLSRPLMELATTKHPKQFKFTEEYETIFRDLIKAVCENATTYFPDPKLPFYVQTDASMYCAGGRLYQKDNHNNEMLIAAVSRTFTKTERNYTIYKKEALALLYTLRAMDFFLKYAPKVILLVDSKALTYIRLAKESSGILLRFSLELSKYDADIIHVPGKENVVSDLLSREHKDINSIQSDIANKKTISEKDTIKIIDALTIPDNFTLTKSQLYHLLNGPSPPDDCCTKTTKTNKIKEGKKNIKNVPATLNKRNIKMPRTTRSHLRPGVIIPSKMLTRSMARKRTISFADELPQRKANYGADRLNNEFNEGNQLSNSVELSQNSVNQNLVEFERLDNSRRQTPLSEGAKEWRECRATLTHKTKNRNKSINKFNNNNNNSIKSNEIREGSNFDNPVGIMTVNQDGFNDERDNQELDQENEYFPNSYETLKDIVDIMEEGDFPEEAFSRMQTMDENIMKNVYLDESIALLNNIYYKLGPERTKPILPACLAKFLINMHHYTFPGIHKSAARIERDIRHVYYILSFDLKQLIKEQIEDCHICQIYSTTKLAPNYTNLPRFKSPRLSWSIDLITDLPTSKSNNRILIICVDDFSNYVIPIPINSATATNIINAITSAIIIPFGCPHFIRSDEQPGIYNSTEFYTFLTNNNIQLQATAVASPFSNGRAESTIKIFKHSARKFFYQQKLIENWDLNVHYVSNAINQSVNTFGYTPEEIMFGDNIPRQTDLIKVDNSHISFEDAIDIILKNAKFIRDRYEMRKSIKEKSNMTFKNKLSRSSKFIVGDLVLHRQMQVSTGTSSKWKPLFTGPYIINDIDKQNRTAVCQNVTTGKTIKAHFNNLIKYECDPKSITLPASSRVYKQTNSDLKQQSLRRA